MFTGEVMLYPALAMVALTMGVWLRLFFTRVGEMKRSRIHPQAVALSAQAFTDANAEMKERAVDAHVVVAKAAPAKPKQVAWVPPTAKALDGFKPVLPPESPRVAEGTQTLAKADTPARVKR